jgi:hypothetical protein
MIAMTGFLLARLKIKNTIFANKAGADFFYLLTKQKDASFWG